ncbi:MAG: urea ABC transporter permease subunit UrtB [Desulfurellaceae bacterium]|nr:urea ABC transporter permease subunit UrtB [Desulfurellaceae bacterium]
MKSDRELRQRIETERNPLLSIPISLLFLSLILLLGLPSPPRASAAGGDLASLLQGLGAKSRRDVRQAITALGTLNDPAALPALEALGDRRLRIDKAGLVYIKGEDGSLHDALSGATVALDEASLRTPRINNAVRRTLRPVIAQLQLSSLDVAVRLAAAEELTKRPRPEMMDILQAALDREIEAAVRDILAVALAQMQLQSEDQTVRLAAIRMIGESGNLGLRPQLEALVATNEDGSFAEDDPEVRAAAEAALSSFERTQFLINSLGNLFYGASLGSVLLLAALGLGITFGLMGVINMAHGEMLMLGAYASYVVQGIFQESFPAWFDWYLAVAIPAAFGVCLLTGMILERGVIRFLYGRPLETLLATWGISLVLIQSVRLIFGAQNVQVANPAWLSGGIEVLYGVVLPYSRLAIILFVALVVGLVWLILQRTRLGLQVRAVTQNRPMASCMGISAGRVDMWTFGLGSGIAGLGGVALSQIGNVGPELGRLYIVDSFMVVVLGGVGNIAGTVVGALSLGLVNKLLEPVAGAVLGKIGVLIFIILFIQQRPQGLFALKGRLAES